MKMRVLFCINHHYLSSVPIILSRLWYTRISAVISASENIGSSTSSS